MAGRTRESVKLDARRWGAYAAAGIATMAGAPACADADVIHTVYNQHIEDPDTSGSSPSTFSAALAAGPTGQAILRFRHMANSSHIGIAWASLFTNGTATGGLAGQTTQGYRYPYNLPYGQPIQLIGQFTVGDGLGTLAYDAGYPNTQFGSAGTAYVAFRFNVGNGTQFGWARLTMDGRTATLANAYDLVEVAYAGPGESLSVGSLTSGGGAAVPESGSLGLLALGAVGLLTWRRFRRNSPLEPATCA
jgi:hypothetical protein